MVNRSKAYVFGFLVIFLVQCSSPRAMARSADVEEDGSPGPDARTSFELARSSDAGPSIIADFDPRCRFMRAQVFDPPIADQDTHALPYFDQPIERRVHQIWFGGLHRMVRHDPEAWRATAQQFGWSYRMWTDDDLPALRERLEPEAFQILEQLLARSQWHAASDYLRVHLLHEFGGLYVDVDIAPPQVNGVNIDPASVFPMRNVTFMTERWCRNVGSDTALMVGNGFMMAGAQHPFLTHLLTALAENIEEAQNRGSLDAAFVTGPFFVSRVLSGAITVIPQRYMRQLKMFLFDEDYALDAHHGRSSRD